MRVTLRRGILLDVCSLRASRICRTLFINWIDRDRDDQYYFYARRSRGDGRSVGNGLQHDLGFGEFAVSDLQLELAVHLSALYDFRRR